MTANRWVVVVACLLGVAAVAAAECTSTLVPVSQAVVFPNHAAGPLAWTGSAFGVAKLDANLQTNAIWFGVHDANLNQIGADQLVAGVSLGGPKLLLWNGSEFSLFYQTPSAQITMQRIAANGNPIGGPLPIAPAHVQFAGQDFDAAWDASRKAYVVLRTNTTGFERGLWLTVAGPDGTTKSDDLITFLIAIPPQPRVAVTASGIVGIAWRRVVNDQEELAFAVVTPGQGPSSIVSVARSALNPRLATDGRFFLLVYSVPTSGGTTVLSSMKVDTAGKVVTPDALLLSGAQDEVAFSLTASPTLAEWGLLYVSYPFGASSTFGGETRLRRIPFAAGLPQSDAPLSVDLTKTNRLPQSEVVWDGTSYVASVGRVLSASEGTESYLARACPLMVTASVHPDFSLPNVPLSFTAQASGGVPGYTYSWSFGDISADVAGESVTHSYPQLGTYTATVTAKDITGSVATATVKVPIINLRRRPAKH